MKESDFHYALLGSASYKGAAITSLANLPKIAEARCALACLAYGANEWLLLYSALGSLIRIRTSIA
jgi:hypothetical protein